MLQVLAIGTGAAVAGLTGRRAIEAARSADGGSGSCCSSSARWPAWRCCSGRPFLRRLLRLAAPDAEARGAPPVAGIVFGIGANLVAWVGYGFALWLLTRGLLPAAGLDPALAIAVFTASYLAGFLALFAPGGIGVREGLFILMLQGPLGIAAATALALASRVLLTITEFGAAVPFLVFSQRSARVAP